LEAFLAAGVNSETVEIFEENLDDNLYKNLATNGISCASDKQSVKRAAERLS
jgi:hypothetical protein